MDQTLALPREKADEDFRALLDLAPDAVFLAGRGGQLIFVNDAACAMTGWPRSELLGRPIGRLLDVRWPSGDSEGLEVPWHGGRLHELEAVLRRADGSSLRVRVTGRLLANGQIQAWVRNVPAPLSAAAQGRGDREDGILRALLDHLPMGVLIFHRSGQLYFNRRSEELLGMKLSPAGGTRQFEVSILQAGGQPIAEAQLISRRVLQGGETLTGAEYLIARPDGTRLPVLCCAGPIRFSDGCLTAGVAVLQDTTEHKRMEHRLSANERLLETIFDLLPVGIWLADRNGGIVGNNPAAERIWNGARYVDLPRYGEYKGWRLDTGERIAAEDWALARAVTKGETTPRELVRIECFDGTFKTIINSGAPLRNQNGDIIGGIVVNEDITQLHEAQEKQRVSEELLRTVFNLLPVGLWISDRQGRITLANPAAEHMWSGDHHDGSAQGDVQYKAWWAETGEPVAEGEWALARALRGETSHSELIRIQCFDGSTKTMMNWAAPIRSAAGEIMGAIGVNEDVTSLQYTQEQLRCAVRERERILAVVAHDLRNPLAALMAHAAVVDLAARRLPGGEKVVAQAASMVDIGRRMSGLVKDLLSVGTAGAGGHHMLAMASVSPGSLLSRAAEAVRPLMEEKELALEIRPADDLPTIRADVDRILRVLGNLLDNALKFTEPSGRVTLSAKSTSAGIRFAVANSGPAIPESELELMFQPFWQAGNNHSGTGLGLAICRSIVEAHGGTIWAEPAEGRRLRVCFVLPRGQASG
jgi:PAS domain S-box-containing protein